MNLKLLRRPTALETTLGQLFIEDSYECKTLEDAIRVVKIQDKTCIPPGKYKVTLELSQRFGPETLTINDVPGFSHIRIHGGNTHLDTQGCVIVGDRVESDTHISGGAVRGVLKRLKYKIKAGLEKGDVWLTVVNPESSDERPSPTQDK